MTTADKCFAFVVVLFLLYIALDAYMSRKRWKLIFSLVNENHKLVESCKALRKHARACRDMVADPDGDYGRELSKMIAEADDAIKQGEVTRST